MAGRLHGDALRVVSLRVLETELAVVHYFFRLLLLVFVAVELDSTDGSFRPTFPIGLPIDHDRARIVSVLAGNGVAWIPPGQIRVLLVQFYLWLLVLFYF